MGTYSYGQSSPRLLLNSGTYELSSRSMATEPNANEGLTLVRVVQFTRPLIDAERSWLESNIGQIISYLPEDAYLMLIHSGLKGEDFGTLPIYGVANLTPEMKMTGRVLNLDLPDYAWRGDRRFEVLVGLDPNANAAIVADNLSADGFDVVDFNDANNTIALEINIDQRNALAANPHVLYIQVGEAPEVPDNFNATRSARSRAINGRTTGSYHYDGTGVVVGHGDDGDIGPHIDYTGRIIARNTSTSTGNHGDHVAGTIFGAGNINPLARGMAPGAELYYYTYPRNLNLVDADYAGSNVRITNSSYSNGCNAGYTSFSQQVDEDIIQNPKLMHVFSAGNDGTSNCSYGAGSGWGNITGGHKVGKNVMTTANVTSADVIASSSSRGPAADGRIKPDIASVGTNVLSTIDPDTYGTKTGTSMAAPGIAGAAAQLFQAFVENGGNEPDGGLLKAIMMNTADDLGNPGPDFLYGYGRANNLRAVREIEAGNYITDSISTNETDSFLLTIPANTAQVKVMVYWTDPAATPMAARVLVNDLDASLKLANGNTFQPWVLDPTPVAANLNANAVRARDSLNNAEQITLDFPNAGDFFVKVHGTSVAMGPQKYYIVYSFIENAVEVTYPFGGEAIIAGSQTSIYWDASNGSTGFTVEYSDNNGSTWSSIGTAAAAARQISWNVPSSLATDQALVRVTRGTQSDVSNEPVVIIDRPNQLSVVQACPDSFVVNWLPVAGAAEYEVYALGNKYMDSIARTTDTFYVFHNYPPYTDIWYSASAVPTLNGPSGERAFAKMKTSGLRGCAIQSDLSVAEMISPQLGDIPQCHDLSAMPVIIQLTNGGISTIDTIPLVLEFQGNLYRDTLITNLISGLSTTHTFSTTLSVATTGTYTVKVWGELASDGNRFNDTIVSTFNVVSSTTSNSVPFTENFDSWTNCSTNTNCGSTVCPLFNGFVNLLNGSQDDIDWRTSFGATTSSGTGPTSDHTTGTNTGKYLYLEASGSCQFMEAVLITPCIDLTGSTLPEFSFWYHMNGPDIGDLHVDMFTNGRWYLDVIPAKSGPQGNTWMRASMSLQPWIGQTVSFRFRGSTGADYQGDMAIDDIQVLESATAPTAAFTVSNSRPCLGEVVDLIDQSIHVPNNWTWTITPNTYSFVNGTSANDQNPKVQFNSLGSYDIKLVSSNSIGSDSITQVGVVALSTGYSIPFEEDFQNGFVPTGWTLVNPDNNYTWESQSCFGYDGSVTLAARVNNFNYNASGQVDALESGSIDFTGVTNPAVVFDLSYGGQLTNNNDRLRIDISTDCGITWNTTSYNKTGAALQTTAGSSSNYIPTGAGQWRRDTLDLTAFSNMSVKLRFVNITDGGNNTYIDNIQLYDLSLTPPVAGFTSSLQDSCINKPMTFTYSDPTASVTWDFGSGATPATATGVGPHSVNYSFSGSKLVKMTATNAGGRTVSNEIFILDTKPNARFNFTIDPTDSLLVNFTNTSNGLQGTYEWDFGDGSPTTNATSPSHQYTTGGDYNVQLIAANRCAPDTIVKTVAGVSVIENAPSSWTLLPNPASDFITLMNTEGQLDWNSAAIYNVQGQLMKAAPSHSTASLLQFDIRDLPAGVYFLRVETEEGVVGQRFVVDRQ